MKCRYIGGFLSHGGIPSHERPFSYTLWLFNVAMENGAFIDGLPNSMVDLSMAMLVITRWYVNIDGKSPCY